MVMSLLTRPKKTVATIVIAADGSGDFNTDGVDDNVQIQAAIDSLPAGGGCIYIREGIYNISATINITTNNVALIGCGRSTQIQTTANILMLRALNVSGILIDSIFIYGDGIGSLANTGIRYEGTTTDSFIHHCWIENCAGTLGIIIMDSNDNEISDCYIENNFDDAIHCFLHRTRVINNYIKNNTNGIMSEGDNCLILGNYCENNGEGIYTRGNDNVIMDNVCIGNARGIDIRAAGHVLIYRNIVDGNICNNNTHEGISVYESSDCIVSNNVCYGNDLEDTVTYSGIEIEGSSNNIIEGNRCMDNDNYEIEIKNTGFFNANKNLLLGNFCIGTDHAGSINDAGINTQIFNNIES